MVCDIVCAGLLDVDVVDAIVAIGVAHFGEMGVGILGLLCADLEACVALRVEAAVVGALGEMVIGVVGERRLDGDLRTVGTACVGERARRAFGVLNEDLASTSVFKTGLV